ncbi:PfkB family carbohydrate kinase [Actinokineospora sp. NBRC 105648]|uniref:carbohydrate kinase family protein n=1 Tax=Actinokineospora sp. NBRC 105648 TaxID=3032206 RepID=UPI0024A05C59|nr:PfkB family carbohydrate kinase [Actinokineospora sp. NBRC 105648]GLZ38712.1 ribokinase [Actinokineospora sp. NBRC 105648]
MAVVVVGDTALDVIARHAGPIAHGDDSRARITLSAGGAGANAAAWLAELGVGVTLVSRVGQDSAAAQARAELTARGVCCAFTVDPDASTGCVVVLVDGTGQRTMLPDRGANARLQASDLVDLSGAGHLHLSGYVLLDEASRAAGVEVLAAARAAGLTTSVDPQSVTLLRDRDAFVDAVRGVDLLLPNADEFRALGGKSLLDVVGAVAVTYGAEGAAWMERSSMVSVPALEVACVDTTGAGDAFNAGLLSAWLSGGSARAALAAGVAAGARAVGQVGAQPTQPTHPSMT